MSQFRDQQLKEMIKKAASNLKEKLLKSHNPLAAEWLTREFGEMLEKAINGDIEEINNIPHFEFFAHGGFAEVEDEYFEFHSLICFGKSILHNLNG